MSFSVGIVGLPNVGKSTLFKALTKKQVAIAARPFTTIHPNLGIVQMPDERLSKIAEIIKPQKITPTAIEFVDIAGLVKGAHKGEGLGNQFLAEIRNCHAILEVVRDFENPEVENVLGELNPEKEIGVIKTELLMKDLETMDNLLGKLEKESKADKQAQKKLEVIKKIKENVEKEKGVAEIDLTLEEKKEIKEYQFLTAKPIFYIININGHAPVPQLNVRSLVANLKDEEELSELSAKEAEEFEIKSQLDQLIADCYQVLDLITFFTVAGGKETRAWTLKRGLTAPEAGGVVHTDFHDKFIRAEVVPWDKLVQAQNWHRSRELGWVKIHGKDYVVQDGDVIEFRI